MQVVLSAALQQTLGGAEKEQMWVWLNRADVGGAGVKRMWVGLYMGGAKLVIMMSCF